MCDKKRLERYYEKVRSETFDNRAIKTYETFVSALNTVKDAGDEVGFGILNGIENTADRYLKNITNYNPEKLHMMSPGEMDLKLKEWSEARRFSHNSLISKINMGTRYFLNSEFGNIANLPKVTQETREIAGRFADELILGNYLKR